MSLPVAGLAEIFGNPFFPVLGWRCYRLGGTDGHQEYFASRRKLPACRLKWIVDWFSLCLALRTEEIETYSQAGQNSYSRRCRAATGRLPYISDFEVMPY